VLLEPKFLRYHNLLEDHFGYRQGDEPGAAYLEQWQELNRNFRHLNRFQKREKLRELNKMFEANKGKFDIIFQINKKGAFPDCTIWCNRFLRDRRMLIQTVLQMVSHSMI